MMTPRRWLRTAGAAVLCCAAREARAQIARVADTPAQVSGTLSVVWADPVTFRGKPIVRAFVLDDATHATYAVSIDSVQAARYGGLVAMSGRRVTLRMGDGRRVAEIVQLAPPPAPAAISSGIARVGGNAAIRNPFTPAPATSGTRKYVILGCRYSDTPAPWDINLAAAMWNTDPVSVKGFWQEVSGGALTMTADAADWKTLPGARLDYQFGSSGEARLNEITADCVAAHDATVDFSGYDGIAFQMSSDLGCCAVSGQRFLTNDGVAKSYDVIWVPGNLADPKGIAGTYTHELGHNLGLLHTVSSDEQAYSARWNVMSDAFAGDEGGARFGAQILAAQKEQLGWIPSARTFLATAATSTITLERNAQPGDNANYLVAMIPVGTSERFYAVELRKAVAGTYDRIVPREGVLIHDWYMPQMLPWASKVVDNDGNGDPNDDGAAWVAGETFLDARNGISVTVDAITATSATITIRNGGGVVFHAAASGLKRTMTVGDAAVLDSIEIRMDGAVGGSLGWTAARVATPQNNSATWMHLTNPLGTGTGPLRIRHDPSRMAPGVYVDSIQVTSPAFDKRIVLRDTLVIAAPNDGVLRVGLSIRSHADSAFAPFSPAGAAFVNITGPGASSVAWTATSQQAGTAIGIGPQLLASGTGPDSLRWTRLQTGNPAPTLGLHLDTITVTLTGSGLSVAFVDTLITLPTVEFSTPLRRGKQVSRIAGSSPELDSLEVGFVGVHGVSGEWFVKAQGPGGTPKENFFLDPVRNYERQVLGNGVWRGVGNGWFRYRRGNRELAPGTYVDTLYVSGPFAALVGDPNTPPAHQGTQYVIDTLVITDGPRSMTFVPPFRYDTLVAGMSSTTDSVRVVLLGDDVAHVPWVATARGTYAVPNYMGSTARGANVAPNAVSWQRAIAGLAPGLYVDTIDVTTTFGPVVSGFVVDTFVIVAPAAMQVPVARVTTVRIGAADAPDSLDVSLLGAAGSGVAWTAAKKQGWTTFTTATGIGSGKVRWTRALSGLAVGTYVDTITVTADGGSVAAQRFVDTVRVLPAISLAVSPTARTVTVSSGSPVPDSAAVTLTNGPYVTWAAGKKQAWTTLVTAFGTGSGIVRWTRNPGSLAPATYVDTITIAASDGVAGATIVDTMIVAASTVLATSATSRRATGIAGQAPISDSLGITMTGPLASSTTWTATKRQNWTTLTSATGGNGDKVRWTRHPNTLSPGTYVDTITVAATQGVNGGTLIDTLIVTLPTAFAAATMTPDSSGGVIGMDVTTTLSINLTAVGLSLASYATLVTWDSTFLRLDSVRAVAGGFVAPASATPTLHSVSLSATDATGRTGAVALARLHFHIVADAPAGGVQTSINTSFSSANSIASQQTNLVPAITTQTAKVVHLAGALRGDVNLDGKITSADALAVVRALVGNAPQGTRATPNGDANCNGKLEAIDAQIILRKIAGQPVDTFCVGTIK